jgi:hypothetical protein
LFFFSKNKISFSFLFFFFLVYFISFFILFWYLCTMMPCHVIEQATEKIRSLTLSCNIIHCKSSPRQVLYPSLLLAHSKRKLFLFFSFFKSCTDAPPFQNLFYIPNPNII